MKRVQLSSEEASAWAGTMHLLALEALAGTTAVEPGQMAFHGGTSLHLSWNSPRFSEDLDFLLDRQVEDIGRAMRMVAEHVKEGLQSRDPAFRVDLTDKTRNRERMSAFVLTASHPGYHGVAKVKVEFWKVSRKYLDGYPTRLRTPQSSHPGARSRHAGISTMVSAMLPAATLETAFCDKLVALSSRPYLKWRDMFDLWWIGTQSTANIDISKSIEQFRHNLSAYAVADGLSPAAALRKFAAQDKSVLEQRADPDLKAWLPPQVWRQIQGRGVGEIVNYVCATLVAVADVMEPPGQYVQSQPKRPTP